MRLVTWNVNGVRSLQAYHPWNATRLFRTVLDSFNADILCFQETKITRDKLDSDLALVEGYDSYYSFCRTKTGYSGTATYCRQGSGWTPCAAEDGVNGTWTADKIGHYVAPADVYEDAAELKALDSEGRCVITDHGAFVLFNCYCPNSGGGNEDRVNFKMRFNRLLQTRVDRLLAAGRQVVVVGDVNVCHQEVDTCDPQRFVRLTGLPDFASRPDRQWLNRFLVDGGGSMVDTFRHFHPDEKNAYTCWETISNARETNYGTRIDYVLASRGLVPGVAETPGEHRITDCHHLTLVRGSDHCPVVSDWEGPPPNVGNSVEPPALCCRRMPEFSGKQQTLASFFAPRRLEATAVDAAPPTPAALVDGNPSSATVVDGKPSFATAVDGTPGRSDDVADQAGNEPSGDQTRAASASATMPSSAKASAAGAPTPPPPRKPLAGKPAAPAVKAKGSPAVAASAAGKAGGGPQAKERKVPEMRTLASFFAKPPAPPSPAAKEIIGTGERLEAASAAREEQRPGAGRSEAVAEAPWELDDNDGIDWAAIVDDATLASPGGTAGAAASGSAARARDQWKGLLRSTPRMPLCTGHREPCVMLTVNKPGPNRGRDFFICARPKGDAKDKTTRCNFFEWAQRRSTDTTFNSRRPSF